MDETQIDRKAIDRLLAVIGGNRDDLLELLEEFFSAAPEILRRMEHAANNNDINALRIASHSLKSNGRDFGAVTLAGLCENLERACKSGTVEDAPGQVTAIASAFDAARRALERGVPGNE